MYLNGLNDYVNRFAPSPDPSLTIKYYERTPEQQALLGYVADSTQNEGAHAGEAVVARRAGGHPHGSVGAVAGHRAIAQSNSAAIADAFFRYSAPEEVCCATKSFIFPCLKSSFMFLVVLDR